MENVKDVKMNSPTSKWKGTTENHDQKAAKQILKIAKCYVKNVTENWGRSKI